MNPMKSLRVLLRRLAAAWLGPTLPPLPPHFLVTTGKVNVRPFPVIRCLACGGPLTPRTSAKLDGGVWRVTTRFECDDCDAGPPGALIRPSRFVVPEFGPVGLIGFDPEAAGCSMILTAPGPCPVTTFDTAGTP